MSTVPADTEHVEPIAEDIVRAARLTVARNALNPADLAELLDMLGIGADKCGGLMTSPDGLGKQHSGKDGVCWRCLRLVEVTAADDAAPATCNCGRPAIRGESQCPMCRDLISADQFRAAYDRIRTVTGHSRAEISRTAGLNSESVRTVVVPSSKRERVTRKLYDQLVSAYQDEVDFT